MSGQSRFERLETEIVDALRRTPGAEPSADLDARILARAHAAVAKAPVRRSPPYWMSLAAGLVVLVGSGLALRIWEQIERVPSPLDAPPTLSAPAAESVAPANDDGYRSAEKATSAGAQGIDTPAVDAAPIVDLAAPAKPASLRRDQAPADAGITPSTAPVAAIPIETDRRTRSEAQPFPAVATPVAPAAAPARRQEAIGEMGLVAPLQATGPARQPARSAAPLPAPQPLRPPPAVAEVARPEPMPAAADNSSAAAIDIQQHRAAKEQMAEPQARAVPAEGSSKRLRDAFSGGDSAGAMSSQFSGVMDAPTTLADEAIDPFETAVDAARKALKDGDLVYARRLIQALREDFPQRELPQDLRFADDAEH